MIKKIKFLFLLVFVISGYLIISNRYLKVRYPDGLLTDDYGILQEEDLLYDLKQGNPYPYDINKFQSGYYRWQCFPAKDVILDYDKWQGNDPLGSSEVIVTLCLFGIKVQVNGISHVYIDRRARLVEFCQELTENWQRLTMDQEYICLNGEPHDLKGKEKYWTWNKMKTQKGCVSLFEGDCDVGGKAL